MLASAEDKQTKGCDATASPNNESPSNNGDSDAKPNYLLIGDSYSYNLITRFLHLMTSKFLHWMKQKMWIRPQKKKNWKAKSRKIKRALPSEWKRHKTKLLRNAEHANWNFKRCTEISARKIRPPCGATRGQNCFTSSPIGKDLIFSKNFGLCKIWYDIFVNCIWVVTRWQ